jgi:hypothetical protein
VNSAVVGLYGYLQADKMAVDGDEHKLGAVQFAVGGVSSEARATETSAPKSGMAQIQTALWDPKPAANSVKGSLSGPWTNSAGSSFELPGPVSNIGQHRIKEHPKIVHPTETMKSVSRSAREVCPNMRFARIGDSKPQHSPVTISKSRSGLTIVPLPSPSTGSTGWIEGSATGEIYKRDRNKGCSS